MTMQSIFYYQDKCNKSFRELLSALVAPARDFGGQLTVNGVTKVYGRYKIWAGNVGAVHGPEKRISLDHRLRDASFYRDRIIELLRDLTETNKKAITLLENRRKPFEECSSPPQLSSDSDSDFEIMSSVVQNFDSQRIEYLSSILRHENHDREEIPDISSEDKSNIHKTMIPPPPMAEMMQIFQSIQDILQQLYKMSLIIRRPVPRNTLDKSASIDVSHYVAFDKEHVQERFPCAKPELTLRLAKAITRRRQLLLYRERHHQALARVEKGRGARKDSVIEDTAALAPSQPQDDAISQQLSHTENKPMDSSYARSTEATSFITPELSERTRLEEQVSASSIQSSLASVTSGKDDENFPPCPADLSHNVPTIFECPLCFYMVELRTIRDWRRHVLTDMQPYICTFSDCETPSYLYETRLEWFTHEMQTHRIEWCCNIEHHPSYESKEDFIKHIQSTHSSSFSERQLADLLTMCQRPSQSATIQCPLCSDDHEEYISGELKIRRDVKYVLFSGLESHLGHHLEQLALFAVPPSLRAGGEETESIADRQGPAEFRFKVYESKTEDDEDLFLSISIDFGTTFSGVAWALSISPKDINVISSWDSDQPHNSYSSKVPSALTYNSKNEVTSWGFALEAKRRKHVNWFKLGLSENAIRIFAKDEPERFEHLMAILAEHGKQPVDVAADYLRCLWTHATDMIQRVIGKDLWESVQLRLVLTVPAIWDHKAQELTRKAAEMAGMLTRSDTTLVLIDEPEAAALAVLEEMSIQRKQSLKIGDSFVICDAGAGAVDLISYKIEQIKPLKLAMVAQPTGGLCGAIFLDSAFEELVRTMITAEVFDGLGTRAKRKMMNDWEYGIKRTFKMDALENESWHVDIPGYLGRSSSVEDSRVDTIGVDRSGADVLSLSSVQSDPGTLILKAGHLNAIFGAVCSKIKDLISTQLSDVEAREGKQPVAILLVGGFGENRYLKQDLDRSFDWVEVLQPVKAWSAVCRGAILRGLGSDVVINHISKHNYGCSFETNFIDGKHMLDDRMFCDITCCWVADNQIEWFLKRGENVAKDVPVQHNYWVPVTKPENLKYISCHIYYSSSTEAETRITSDVHPLCKFTCSFDPALFKKLRVQKNAKGEEWRKFEYVVEMHVSSGELLWAARHNGVRGGRAKIEYEGIDD